MLPPLPSALVHRPALLRVAGQLPHLLWHQLPQRRPRQALRQSWVHAAGAHSDVLHALLHVAAVQAPERLGILWRVCPRREVANHLQQHLGAGPSQA